MKGRVLPAPSRCEVANRQAGHIAGSFPPFVSRLAPFTTSFRPHSFMLLTGYKIYFVLVFSKRKPPTQIVTSLPLIAGKVKKN